MRLPHVRFTVRRLMLLVAAIAVGLVFLGEFAEGLPPQFVIRGIPARIAQLRPGMNWERTREILGLEQSWLLGGTGAYYVGGDGSGHALLEAYCLRTPRAVVVMKPVGGGNAAPVKTFTASASLKLWFRTDAELGTRSWRRDKSTRLLRASFCGDSATIAVMPGSFPVGGDPPPP